MKKFLSLVLALVMTMSLVTISAGAKDFTDSSKLNYKEAVNVISALDVVDGYADGTFKPGNSLTGYAFMKFLLGALGYDKDIEGYNGANWSINVAKRALNIGLDDGLVDNFNGTKPVTREEACLYAFNTLPADMVDYDNRTTVSVGGAEVVIAGSKAEPIYKDLDLSKNYDFAVVVDGELDDDDIFWATKKDIPGGQKADKKIDNVIDVSPVGVGNGSLVKVFEDEGIITVVNTYPMQVAGDYNEKKETLTLVELAENNYPSTAAADLILPRDDFAGLDEYKDEDYVIVTVAEGEIQTIAPAEKVSATVTDYVHEESLTAGGEKYEYAVANNDNTKAYTLMEYADIYLDPYGYILFAKAVSAKDSYVYISEFATINNLTSNSKVVAYAYFTNGTEDDIPVSKLDDNKVTGLNVTGTGAASQLSGQAIGWFKYTEKEDGKFQLTSLADTPVALPVSGVVTDYSAQHAKIGTGAIEGNKNTIFVVVKPNNDVVIYTGIKNVPDITAAAGSTIKGGNVSSDIVFLLKCEKQGNDTDDDYRYKALLNGEETKVYVDKEAGADLLAGKLYTDIEYTSKNYMTEYTEVTGAVAANREDFTKDTIVGTTVTQKDNTLLIGTQADNDYFMADQYSIYVVTGTSYEVLTMKQLAREGVANGSTIYGVMNADAEYTALYIYHA